MCLSIMRGSYKRASAARTPQPIIILLGQCEFQSVKPAPLRRARWVGPSISTTKLGSRVGFLRAQEANYSQLN